MKEIEFIIYVANQNNSRHFYENVLQIEPSLHVPGMTEFRLSISTKLGLMPENGIAKILNDSMPHPNNGSGIPRCELYLKVENASEYIKRGSRFGGKIISELTLRNWGDKVGYISDLDGHIIAFAEK